MDGYLRGYLDAAAWLAIDGRTYDPVDGDHSADDFSARQRAIAARDVRAFVKANHDAIVASKLDPDRVGHYFWLSRNGHGAGFFDVGEHGLQKRAKEFGAAECVLSRGRLTFGW